MIFWRSNGQVLGGLSVLLILGSLSATASADDSTNLGLTLTNTGIAEYRADNQNGRLGDDHYLLLLNRLNLGATAGRFSSQIRVDGWRFINTCPEEPWPFFPQDIAPQDGYVDAVDLAGDGLYTGIDLDGDGFPDAWDRDGSGRPTPMPGCVPIAHGRGEPYRSRVELERLSVSMRLNDSTLTFGDFFQQLGNGIILSIRKVDEAGLDVAIRGGLFETRTQNHRARVFAGMVNPANLDSVNQRYVAPVDDVVAGYAWEYRGWSALRLQLFGAFLGLEDRLDEAHYDYSLSQGLSVEFPELADSLSLNAEADVQYRMEGGEPQIGGAGTLSLNAWVGDFSALADLLWLHNFEQGGSGNTALSGARFRYNQPPTLERIDQETANASTTVGGRVRLEQHLGSSGLLAWVTGTLLLNDYGSAAELRQLHVWGGLQARYDRGRSRAELSGGYRNEVQTNLPPVETPWAIVWPGHQTVKTMGHVEVDWRHAMAGPFSLLLSSNNELRTLMGDPYARGSTILGLDRARLGSVAFEFGYDTQMEGENIRQFFYAGIVRWELSEHFTLGATGGTQRGGIKCINGICRDYPAFAGARLELIARY